MTRRNNGKPLPPYIQAAHGKQAGRGPPRNLSGNKEGKYSHLPGEGHWAKIVTVASVASVEQAYSVSTWSTLMYTQVQYTATVDLSLCWDFQCCRSSTGILIKVQFRKTCFTQHVAKFHFHKTIGILKIYLFTHTLFYFKEQSTKIKFGIRFKNIFVRPQKWAKLVLSFDLVKGKTIILSFFSALAFKKKKTFPLAQALNMFKF